MSVTDRRNLRKLRSCSRELNRMIDEGGLRSPSAGRCAWLVRRARRLSMELLGVVPEATLRGVLAGAAVLVLGVAGCAQTTPDITSDVGPDVDAVADVADALDALDAADVPDGLDALDGLDAVDAIDAADAIDGADAVDAVDALDAVDAIDAADVQDVSDATDDCRSDVTFVYRSTNPFGLSPSYTYVAMPAFGDLDSDGDLDLLIGSYYYYSSGVHYYQNTGTASAAAFAAGVLNPFGISWSGYYPGPALGDLDGDGDLDLLVGTGDYYGGSSIHYYQNTGSATAPAFATPVENPFGISGLGPAWIVPLALEDIDDDGDLDIFLPDSYGRLVLLENTGTATSPAFASPVTNPFGITSSGYLTSHGFADLDEDSDPDLLMSSYDYYTGSSFRYFQNTGTATSPAFAAPCRNPFGLTASGYFNMLAFADIDADGDRDLFVCVYGGSLRYHENTTP